MNKIIITTSLLLGLSTTAIAGEANIPNNFSAGSPAIASEVNANFSALKDAIDDNHTRIGTTFDYRDYISNASSKTFTILNPNDSGRRCGDTEIQNYTRTPNGDNTDITMVRRIYSSGEECRRDDFTYTNTPTSRLLKEHILYDSTTGEITRTNTSTPPATLATSNMVKGASFSSASIITKSDAAPSDELTTLVMTRSISEQASVTVPAGSFTDCINIYEDRTSFGFGSHKRVLTYCNSVGLVKVVSTDANLELESITP